MKQTYHHRALRQALLDAAERILDRDGIGALTLRAAAREAGVSHGAPAHHFGDLGGLLTELAASGFHRLRTSVEVKTNGTEGIEYVRELGRGYIQFARSHPGIFLLMFRSERLDWSAASLSQAGPAAFALLARGGSQDAEGDSSNGFESLVRASTRWSLLHGLATLLIDGRLGALSAKVPKADIEELVERVIIDGLKS